MRPRFTRRLIVSSVAALALGAGAAGAASAANPGSVDPAMNVPAVSEYIEQVPSAAGARGVIQARGNRRTVPKELQREIAAKAGKDAGLLTDATEAAEYGAPFTSATGSVASAGTSSGMNALLILFGVLFAASLVAAGVVTRRRSI